MIFSCNSLISVVLMIKDMDYWGGDFEFWVANQTNNYQRSLCFI